MDRLDHSGGHGVSGVPVAGADPAATVQLPMPAALVAHEFVDHAGGDAGVLQPGREGVPEVVRATQVQVVELGALDGGLVHATDAVSRQHRSAAGGHVVAAAGAGEHQCLGVSAGRELAADRLNYQGSERDLADAGVALGCGLKPLPNRPAW